INPINGLAWADLAFAYHGLKRFQDGKDAAMRATSLDEAVPEAWNARGLCEMELGLLENACLSFRKAFQLANHDWRVAANLGVCLRQLESTSESVQYLERASQINPGRACVWRELAVSLLCDGRLLEAREAIDRSLSIDQSEAKSWILRAM